MRLLRRSSLRVSMANMSTLAVDAAADATVADAATQSAADAAKARVTAVAAATRKTP